MTPKPQEKTTKQDMCRNRLDIMLDHRHALYVLDGKIDWSVFDDEFGARYSEKGRPGVATRLMVGLHYLKHTFNESDESAVARFVENPYEQHFCGLTHFTQRLPIDPSTMTRWRKRIGVDGVKSRP
jgi:transposase, IS5 family